MNPWPEYFLEDLDFKNGATVRTLNSPRQLYNLRDQIVAFYGLTKREHARLLALAAKTALKDIFYWIRIFDGKGGRQIWAHRFRHPFPAGTFVVVLPPPKGAPAHTLFIRNRDGKKLFSDRFTVSDITNGEIKSSVRAFQFLEN